ncbi:MAG: hypothetical protein QG596_1107 [Actinomycetota bacterium]|nr:hypothetical protein [Actinomycetota bacterium]
MDELKALKQMRSGLPQAELESKEKLWLRLQQEAEIGKSGYGRSRARRLRAIRGFIVGLVLLGGVALSPAGPAVADKVSDLLGGDMTQSRQEINEIDDKIRSLSPTDLPPGLSPQERHEAGAARIQAIIDEVAKRPGGIEKASPYPPGVVIRIKPNPLQGQNLQQYDEFCERVAERLPNSRSCDLNRMVQAGQLPPGDYTQAQIDRIFEGDGE